MLSRVPIGFHVVAEPQRLLACRSRVGIRWERTDRRNAGIAVRAPEHGETGWQESEPFVVPWKSGNSSREDPAEGREGRVTDPLLGTKARTPSLSTLSTHRQRIAQRGGQTVT